MTTMIYAARNLKRPSPRPIMCRAAIWIPAIRTAARNGHRRDHDPAGAQRFADRAGDLQGFYYGLVKAGVKLMLFEGGLLHAKIISVDDEMVMLGSANMDRRELDTK